MGDLVLLHPARAYPRFSRKEITCTVCKTVDSDGTSGPPERVDRQGFYELRVRWLCRVCSDLVWRAHLAAHALRSAQIAWWQEHGYAPRAWQLVDVPSEQLVLL